MDVDALDAQKYRQLLSRSVQSRSAPSAAVHLPLPRHLQILCDQTESMLMGLRLLRSRRQLALFPRIREIVENQTGHSFTEATLCQSLRILPENVVKTEWHEDQRRILPHQLHLIFDPSHKADDVMAFARGYLLDHVKGFHSDFLRRRGERVSEIREWHAQFDLNSVPPIPGLHLERPGVKQQMTITEAFQSALPKRESISVIPAASQPPGVPKSCANLDSYFAVARRVREKAVLKEQLLEVANQRHTTELLSMADNLNTIFHSKRKTCLPLTDVMVSLDKTTAFQESGHQTVMAILEELIDKSDGYFSRLVVRGVAYVRVEPDSKRTYQMARGPIVRAVMGEAVVQPALCLVP